MRNRRMRRRRQRGWAAAFAVILLGGALGTLVGGGGDDEGAPVASTAPTATVPAPAPDHTTPPRTDPGGTERGALSLPPEGKLFGFSDSAFEYTGLVPNRDIGVRPEQQVADLLAVGANAARIAFAWNGLEAEQGQYDQSYVDRLKAFTDAFEARGGRVLLTLLSPPDWARAAQEGPTSAIADRPEVVEAFARMAGFVARTWPRAAGIETGNEVNTKAAWSGPGPQPEFFTRLHKAAATAIREQTPRVPVILAAMAGPPQDNDDQLGPQSFLKRMYAAGLRPEDYDALAIHPYPVPENDRTPRLNGGTFAAQLNDFRLGYRNRDPDARVWVTETGSTTTGEIAVSAEEQARLLPRLIRKLVSLDRVDAVFLHTLYEPGGLGGTRSKETGFGLLRAGASGFERAKPAYCALRALARRPGPTDACPTRR